MMRHDFFIIDRHSAPSKGLFMNTCKAFFSCLIGAALAVATTSAPAQSKSYPDGHGGQVTFPQGDVSFADEVVSYDTGSKAPKTSAADPEAALGIPDYRGDRGYATLGCGGTLVLKFSDNALVDVPGDDLHVFEIGPDVEPTALAISPDGESWTRVGRIEGGKAAIDIEPYVDAGASFRYVRLVDLRAHCGSETPGADIDAVGAIGSARRIALSGKVLFDTGKYQLKEAATKAIDKALVGVDPATVHAVEVAGYTDSVGSDSANQLLSENRAKAVAAYLVDQAGFAADKVRATGHGENQPVASNDTAEGRAKNRRVEITVRATQTGTAKAPAAKVTIIGLWDAGSKGTIELSEVDGQIHGTYPDDNGRIRGTFSSETVIDGYWIENGSNKTCKTEKDGSKHWGELQITFTSPSRDEFTSQWRYCGEDEWQGAWANGKRIL